MSKIALAVLGMAALGLSGCGAVQDIGSLINGQQDQELADIKNPPLAVPPDYDLRPPHGGGNRLRTEQAERRGRQMLTGVSAGAVPPAGRSAGEDALLRLAGFRAGINSSVRRDVDQETETRSKTEQQFVDKLLKWKEDSAPPDDQANAEEAKSSGGISDIIGGTTKPTIRRRGEVF